MKVKIEIPCEIEKGLTYVTFYEIIGKRKSDGIDIIISRFLNEDDALHDLELSQKYFSSLYSHIFIYSQILWL